MGSLHSSTDRQISTVRIGSTVTCQMAGSDQAWHFEQVKIKESEYSKKCGISGDCYFYVSKGQIKISQQDNKTSLDVAISRVRTWGASSSTFFLELGSRSPAGEGRLEMTHKDPNALRLLVRQTTKTRSQKGKVGQGAESESGSSHMSAIESDTYYDAPPPAISEATYAERMVDDVAAFHKEDSKDIEDEFEDMDDKVHQIQFPKSKIYQ